MNAAGCAKEPCVPASTVKCSSTVSAFRSSSSSCPVWEHRKPTRKSGRRIKNRPDTDPVKLWSLPSPILSTSKIFSLISKSSYWYCMVQSLVRPIQPFRFMRIVFPLEMLRLPSITLSAKQRRTGATPRPMDQYSVVWPEEWFSLQLKSSAGFPRIRIRADERKSDSDPQIGLVHSAVGSSSVGCISKTHFTDNRMATSCSFNPQPPPGRAEFSFQRAITSRCQLRGIKHSLQSLDLHSSFPLDSFHNDRYRLAFFGKLDSIKLVNAIQHKVGQNEMY